MVNIEFVLQSKAEEQGIEPGDLCKLSQAELSMRLGTDASMGTWRKTRGKGKVGNNILLFVVILVKFSVVFQDE